DWATVLMTLETEVRCLSTKGERIIPLPEFIRDAYTTALLPDEVLSEVIIKVPPRASGGAHLAFKRSAPVYPTASAAVQLTIENVAIKVSVNGKPRSLNVEPRMLLVEFLREQLDLTGTHVGCDTTYCGACTVLMNGAAVKSCTMFAVQADGAEITTVEGLEQDGRLHPIQKAFGDAYGLQCGYCTPGLMLSASQLLSRNKQPSEKDIRKAIAGNTCRCTGYQNIFKAIELAAQNMKGV